MASNSEAELRARLKAFRDAQTNGRQASIDDLPDWLRQQFNYRGGGSESGTEGGYSDPGATMLDSQGRAVVLLNDDGSIDGNDLDFNPDYKGERRFDPKLGWVTDASNVNENKWQAGHRRRGITAAAIIGTAGVLGATGALGGAAAGEGAGTLAAQIPADIAPSGAVAGGSVALDAAPAITATGTGTTAAGTGLAGLGASIPADIAPSGAVAASPGLVDMPAISATGATSPSLLSRAGSMLTDPGTLRGLAGLGVAAAGASHGGSGGGNTDPASIIQQMADANRVNQNTPFGSRNWVQGPDGRWTVNDTLSEPEAANFANVQQLNSGVTGMARGKLAELLAAGPRQRYDRPLGT